MPYKNLKDVPAQIRKHKGCSLTLDQANKWADIYDAVKNESGIDNPAAITWNKFEEMYKIEDGNWIKMEIEQDKEVENIESEEYALSDIILQEIKDVEIFKSGTHNGIEFSDQDIEEIVNNFNLMKKENPDFQLPLTIGHIKDGTEPAVGWFDNVRKIGGSIYTDFVKLPEPVFNLIKTGAYKNRSIELFFNFKQNGKKIGKMLKSCALLGATMPAVNLRDPGNGLESLNVIGKAMYGTAFEQDEESKYIEFSNETESKNGGNAMDVQNAQEQGSDNHSPETASNDDKTKEFLKQFDFIKDPDSLIKFLSETKEKERKNQELIAKFEKERDEMRAKEYGDFVNSLVKEDKIYPSEKGIVTSLLFSMDEVVLKFQANEFDIEQETSQVDLFKKFLSDLPNRGMLKQNFGVDTERLSQDEIYNVVSQKLYSKNFSSLTTKESKSVMAEIKANPRYKKVLTEE